MIERIDHINVRREQDKLVRLWDKLSSAIEKGYIDDEKLPNLKSDEDEIQLAAKVKQGYLQLYLDPVGGDPIYKDVVDIDPNGQSGSAGIQDINGFKDKIERSFNNDSWMNSGGY